MYSKAIFFDLYGTLLIYGDMQQAWSDWVTTFHTGLGEAGHNVRMQDLAGEVDGFLAESEPAGNRGTLLERRIDRACRRLGASLSEGQLTTLADSVVTAWQAHVTLDPETLTLLQDLGSTYRLGLVSNFDHGPHVRRLLAQLDLLRHFETVVISGEVGVAKPDPRIFDSALRETGLQAEHVAYVGDGDVDIKAACGAGMRPILIHRGIARGDQTALDVPSYAGASSPTWPPLDDTTTIQSLAELPGVLTPPFQ